jgi:predicted SAM-dependent methyltransferase
MPNGRSRTFILRRAIGRMLRGLRLVPRAIANPFRVSDLRHGRSLRVHLGCGDDRLDGFINLDCRMARAADVIMDLNEPRFASHSLALAFSNAFFEHLYRNSRLGHLRRIYDALESSGVCCYIGLPFFRNIARYYLERGPGTAGPGFDLYNVYRYTHGDPEHAGSWWLAQLHKSLFDEEELSSLLEESGFRSFALFCYAYPGDVNEVPVAMGFYASRDTRPVPQLRDEATAFLRKFEDKRIRMQTLEWLPERKCSRGQ